MAEQKPLILQIQEDCLNTSIPVVQILRKAKVAATKLDLTDFLKWLNDKNVPVFGHVGIGVLHPRFKDTQEKLLYDMFQKVIGFQGKVSGEHGIGLTKTSFLSDGLKESFKELKEKFDPEHILNKNKIIKFEDLEGKKTNDSKK